MVKIGDFSYYSATEAWFMSRRFPIEIIRPHEYMKTKSKLFSDLKAEDL
jgi:hypothetical protein